MIKKMGYQWRLRHLMAERDMFQTSDLVPLLAERGVVLSREQVYRLVTQPPQRLSMDTLVALCDILDCEPNDLIKPEVVNQQLRKTADGAAGSTGSRHRRHGVRSCAALNSGDHTGHPAAQASGAASGAQP